MTLKIVSPIRRRTEFSSHSSPAGTILIQDGHLSQQVSPGLISQPYVLPTPGWLNFPLPFYWLLYRLINHSHANFMVMQLSNCPSQCNLSSVSNCHLHPKIGFNSVLKTSICNIFRNLLSSHMAHLCSQVRNKSCSCSPLSFSGSQEQLYLTSRQQLPVGHQISVKSQTHHNPNLIPVLHTQIPGVRIPPVWSSIAAEFRSRLFTLLSCEFNIDVNREHWCFNAAKAAAKPATERERYVLFQQLMNICSALAVTALWSAVLCQTDKAGSSGTASLESNDNFI